MDYLPGREISRSDLRNADALITRTRTRCDRELLEGTPVKYIASATIGYDHIDTAYCHAAGIGWTNAPGCNSSSVEQYLLSVLLYLSGRGRPDLSGVTLGVVGAGHVGSRVARAAKALGMEVLINDPPRQRKEGDEGFTALEALLELSEVVSLHVPLNIEGPDSTYHMAGEAFFSRMKEHSALINTSRGPVVDQGALIDAIRSGKVRHAVLDVFENEPEVNLELLELITLGTPHIAGYSADGKAGGTTMAVRAVSRHFRLGLDGWEPESLPLPADPVLETDTFSGNQLDLIRELYFRTYDVSEDDRRLRSEPGAFERLRGAYPLRREPKAYTVRLKTKHREAEKLLR